MKPQLYWNERNHCFVIAIDTHPYEKNMFSTLEYYPANEEWKSDRIVKDYVGKIIIGSSEWERLPDKHLLIDHLFEANHGVWR